MTSSIYNRVRVTYPILVFSMTLYNLNPKWFPISNINTPHSPPLTPTSSGQLVKNKNAVDIMCIETQTNFFCGHSTQTWHYTALQCRLNRHAPLPVMEWKSQICQKCEGKEFRKDMVGIVQWLDKVRPWTLNITTQKVGLRLLLWRMHAMRYLLKYKFMFCVCFLAVEWSFILPLVKRIIIY